MLQNATFLAKIGADTAENEQHFAEILPKTDNYPTGPERPPCVPSVPLVSGRHFVRRAAPGGGGAALRAASGDPVPGG